MKKSCKKGYYYCFTSKKCKKIPAGHHVMGSGRLMKDSEHEEGNGGEESTETTKNGKTNGNGNGGNGGAVSEGWSEKYKKSIDCKNPKGFSQRAHCQGRKVNEAKEKDHEVSMAKTQVKKSIDNLQKVARVLAKKTDADNLPAWVQSKLTDTEHNTDAAASYMTGKEDLDEGKRDGKSAKDKDYSLRDWFKGGGWVQAGGEYDGKPCAKQPGQKTKPFCRDADDRAAMSKEERNKRAKKKRKEDPNPNRKGKAKIVTAEAYNTAGTRYEKEKDPVNAALTDAVKRQKLSGEVLPKIPVKMADSYSNWRGEIELDENALLKLGLGAAGTVAAGMGLGKMMDNFVNDQRKTKPKDYAVKTGVGAYAAKARNAGQLGEQTKPLDKKYKKQKPGIKDIPTPELDKNSLSDDPIIRRSPKGTASYSDVYYDEETKKDACYKKVKARYDVWPSAYASGALVKCRKVGAANWGNKTKKEGYEFSNWRDDFQPTEIKTTDLISPEPIQVPPSNLQKIEEKCWVGYKQLGMKKKGKKMVPNCVKEGQSNWREELSEKYAGQYDKGMPGWKPYGGRETGPVQDPDYLRRKIDDIRKSIPVKKASTKKDTQVAHFEPEGEIIEDWQKVNKGDKTDGMSQKAVDAYKRENPGSKLKTAVTEKNPGGKRAKRRKSFCARSNGQRKMHNIDCSKTPDKAICKARKRWRC